MTGTCQTCGKRGATDDRGHMLRHGKLCGGTGRASVEAEQEFRDALQRRAEAEVQDACESVEAEEARWSAQMRGQAAHLGDVWWPGKPGIDRRVFDVSGHRSLS